MFSLNLAVSGWIGYYVIGLSDFRPRVPLDSGRPSVDHSSKKHIIINHPLTRLPNQTSLQEIYTKETRQACPTNLLLKKTNRAHQNLPQILVTHNHLPHPTARNQPLRMLRWMPSQRYNILHSKCLVIRLTDQSNCFFLGGAA
jgi:hypothetical protein